VLPACVYFIRMAGLWGIHLVGMIAARAFAIARCSAVSQSQEKCSDKAQG
jgi:hypothetical protein